MDKTCKLVFPLIAEVKFKMPVSALITGIEVVDDVSRLVLTMPEEQLRDGKPDPKIPKQEVTLRIYMEGETRDTGVMQGEPGNEKPVREVIPIPGESPELVKLGTFSTVESPATWHVFRVVPPVS